MRPQTDAERVLGRIARGEIRCGPAAAREIAARHQAAYGAAWDDAWATALAGLAEPVPELTPDPVPGVPGPDWLTTEQVAARFGVCVQTVTGWVRRGLLHPAPNFSGHARYAPAEVEALRAARPRHTNPPKEG